MCMRGFAFGFERSKKKTGPLAWAGSWFLPENRCLVSVVLRAVHVQFSVSGIGGDLAGSLRIHPAKRRRPGGVGHGVLALLSAHRQRGDIAKIRAIDITRPGRGSGSAGA